MEPASVDTSTTATQATVSNVDMLGQSMQTLTVSGSEGHSNVSANISNPTDLGKAVKEAEQYIDLALLHLEGK